MSPRHGLGVLAAAIVLLAGCATPLPTHEWMGHDGALRAMAERSDRVRTFRSPCRIVLGRPDGSVVSFEGAVAAEMGRAVRLRAWKFGQGAFDLTATREGVWLMVRDGSSESEGGRALPGGWSAERLAEGWRVFSGDFFSQEGLRIRDDGGERFSVERAMAAGDGDVLVVCEIDRQTLTAREYRLIGPEGIALHTLALGRYRDVEGIVWPTRITVSGGRAESGAGGEQGMPGAGTINIYLEEVELNPQLDPAVFVPPRRAVKQE